MLPEIEGRKRLAASAGLLVLVVAVTELLLFAASFARPPLIVDVGPSTGSYLSGFTESEERPPLTSRWARVRAAVETPVDSAGGPVRIVVRAARFLDQPTTTRVFVSGGASGALTVPPGRFRLHETAGTAPPGRVRLDVLSEDTDGSGLGLAVDWIRIEGPRFSVSRSLLAPRILVAGLFLVALFAGFPARGAALMSLGVGAAAAAWAAFDPFAVAHVSSRVTWPALVSTAVVAALAKDRGRLLVPIFLAGYLLKAGGVFHPSYFYPDVRNHARYVFAFTKADGSVVERGLDAQMQVRTAYPRIVAGKAYAFPYSPLFFVPFSWLPPTRDHVEDALKHVGLLAAAAEVCVVFWLARLILGPGAGLTAAALAAFIPVLYSRLLLATYPTIVGHLLDYLTITLGVRLALRPESVPRALAVGGSALVALLTYISSLFNVSGFFASWALVDRRLRWRVLLIGAFAATVTVGLLYRPFVDTFLREIAPAMLQGGGGSPAAPRSPFEGLLHEAGRIPIFFGYVYPVLAIAGMAIARKRADPAAYRVLGATGLTFLLLAGLRAFGGGIFKDLKEVEFAAPLVAITAGLALETLASTFGRRGRVAAVLLALSLVAFGLLRYRDYLAASASPIDLG